MKPKHLLIITVIFAVLAVLYFIQDHVKYGGTKTPTEKFIPFFPDLLKSSVQSVRAWPGKRENAGVTLVRTDAGWGMSSRFGARANDKVDLLLDDIKAAKADSKFEKESLFTGYEVVDDKALHIVLTVTGGKEHHILVGKKVGRKGAFVRRAGEKIAYRVDKDLRTNFGMFMDLPDKVEYKEWLDLAAAEIDSDKIASIHLAGPYKDLLFENRVVEGQNVSDTSPLKRTWVCAKPETTFKVKDDRLRHVLSAFAKLKGADVADPKKRNDYQLDDPLWKATVTTEDNSTVVFSVGAKLKGKKDRYLAVTGRDEIFTIPSGTVDRLFRKTTDMLELKVFDLKETSVTEISVDDGKKEMTFVRTKGEDDKLTWEYRGPGADFKLKTNMVDRLVKDAVGFKPGDILQDVDVEVLDTFDRTLKMTVGDKEYKVDVGGSIPGREDEHFVIIDGFAGIFSVRKSVLDKLFKKASHFLTVKPYTLKKADVAGISLTRGGETLHFDRKNEKWRTKVSDMEFFGSSSFGRMLNQAAGWSAIDILTMGNASECGFDKPALTAVFTMRRGAEITITVGKSTGTKNEDRFYKVSGRDEIYIAPKAFHTKLAWKADKLIDYRLASVLYPLIKSIEIEKDAKLWRVLQNEGDAGRRHWALRPDKLPDKMHEKSIKRFTSFLKTIKASDIMLPEEAVKFDNTGIASSTETITIYTDAEPVVIMFGARYPKKINRKPHRFAVVGDSRLLLLVAEDQINKLFNELKTLPTASEVEKIIEKEKKAPKKNE